MHRRRSMRLASMDSATNNNGCASSAAVEVNRGLRISGYTRVAKMQMKRKNMKKKILGRKKKGKKKRGRTQEYAQYRCNMQSFFNTMQRIKERLTKGHLELLQQTPFWPLISAFYNGMISEDYCWKSESDIHNIISCYNSRTMSFDFGSTSASLTTKDIAEILGLPQEGEEVELKGSRGYKSDFTERYFDVRLVSKKMVDAALEEALKGKRKTDAKDVIRLILIELCITFLLCNSNHMATGIVIQYCEDLENISRYSWAKVVVDILHRALKTKASQLKSCSVPRCVVVIMAFVDEEVISVEEFGPFEHFICLGIYLHNGNKETLEQAKSHGRENGEEGETVFDDTMGSLEDELHAQTTQMEFLPTPTIFIRPNNGNLEKSSDDLWETFQNASAEVGKTQGVIRLTEKLESKKEKTKKIEENAKRRKEDNEILNAEKKAFFEYVERVVKKLEQILEAERE